MTSVNRPSASGSRYGRDIGVYLRAVGAMAGRGGAESDAGVEKGGGGGSGRWSTTLLARRRPPGRAPLKKHSN
ncbi:Uncharacterized protein DBV15_06203 [Temnothorax longispinosus]|uniref:Uncharacterized protein n=1 Tax=Temnothorax longispinosus TaxID=300112 RepID=A0A4S2KKB1_9HYME|nr:Uncharacterized protein DBV15_06203 [Temnothorax longispinosus]